VEISRAEFERAMARLASELHGSLQPLLSRPKRSWTSTSTRFVHASLIGSHQPWRPGLQGHSQPISLLSPILQLSPEERVDMALMLAFENLWPGVSAAVKSAVDPLQLKVAIYTSLSAYLLLLMIPEPISKLVVLGMTTLFIGYLGLDVFFSLLEGFREMRDAAVVADTIAEVRRAGQHFGDIMGDELGQVLILVAMHALASGGNDIMRQGPKLPRFEQALEVLEAEVGLSRAAVGAVRKAVVDLPSLSVTLSPMATLMASHGSGRQGGPQRPASARPVPRKYRLDQVEEWRKPHLTEDGKVLPYKGTRNPPEPIPVLGRNRAGQVITNGKHTIRFDKNGFAEFDTRFETLIDDVHIGSGDRLGHYQAANKNLHQAIKADPRLAEQLGLTPLQVEELPTLRQAPRDYTWHHHQDIGRMQLVPFQEHALALSHTGGMAIWGGGQVKGVIK
jgi:hypothetical protein